MYTENTVKNNIAFTGEIDLNGNVHAVGGIKEKMRGAFVAGITIVFCPMDNQDDVNQINEKLILGLNCLISNL